MTPGRRNPQGLRLLELLLLILLLAAPGAADAAAQGEEEVKGWIIMPRIGVSLEYGGFLKEDNVFTSMLRRRLEIDALQYKRHLIYMEFDEETYFGTPAERGEFNRLRYRVNILGYRYDLGEHYVGLFYYHWCFNNFLTEKYLTTSGRSAGSLYTVTLEFLTKSMRLGMKDRGINFDSNQPFEWLGRLHYAALVGKVVSQSRGFELDWLLRGQVRCDLFRYYRLIPYLELGGELTFGPSCRVSPWLEGGARYHLRRHLDLTPFFRWGRSQEIVNDYTQDPPVRRLARNYLYGGLRLEYLLDQDSRGETLSGNLQLLPEIHGKASYFGYLQSRFFGWGGYIDVDLEVLRYNPWTLFFYTGLIFDTRKEDLAPTQAFYRLQYGLTYTRGPFFMEGFVDHTKRLDVHGPYNVWERANLAGLRAGTRGMKPGHANDGISFDGPGTLKWLNNWNAQAGVGHYFQNRDWQYLWKVSAQVRWDPLRWRFVVPYVQGEVSWLAGGGRTPDAVEGAAEAGVRLHGPADLIFYYRFQHRENARYFRSPSDNQSLVGVKTWF